MTIQERLDAIKKEYTELEEQVRNITQRMLRLEGAFQVLTDPSQESYVKKRLDKRNRICYNGY